MLPEIDFRRLVTTFALTLLARERRPQCTCLHLHYALVDTGVPRVIDITPDLATYLDNVTARLDQAFHIKRRDVLFQDGSQPLASHCHDNVDRWVCENSGSHPVRGWMVISTAVDTAYIAAHSIVQTADGDLIDITPLPSQGTPFIPHIGSDDRFLEVRTVINNVWWPSGAGRYRGD